MAAVTSCANALHCYDYTVNTIITITLIRRLKHVCVLPLCVHVLGRGGIKGLAFTGLVGKLSSAQVHLCSNRMES
jgi:hypothetical protein